MTNKGLEIFKEELSLIQDREVLDLIEALLVFTPSYFWRIKGSTTGKYHPEDENKPGGKVLHVKRAVHVAKELCHMENILSPRKDMLLGAMILHDMFCQGLEDNKDFTDMAHPYYVRQVSPQLANMKYYNHVTEIIEGHMGRWSSNETPIIYDSQLVKLGQIADYISSKRGIILPDISV